MASTFNPNDPSHSSAGAEASLSRRSLLRSGLLAAGAFASAAAPSAAAATARIRRGRPRNVIFCVSDGMSASVPALAERFSQRVGRQRGTALRQLASDPEVTQGLLDTSSLDGPVTDSAAASSAWASGSLVANGALNYLPDGTRLVPIAPLLADAGWRVGLATTTRITHATPAGFASAVPNRDFEEAIAEQMLGVEVLLGGGRSNFDPKDRGDGIDLLERARGQGYSVVDRAADLDAAGEGRLLGLFSAQHLPLSLDRRSDPLLAERTPTLAAMTTAALRRLAVDDRGFLLQVEGGRVDHAAHNNDAAALLWEQLDFDDAVRVALEFAAARDDTLVVVTADHANGNPGLSGSGGRYRATSELFDNLAWQRQSFEQLLPELLRREVQVGTDDSIGECLLTRTGFAASPEAIRTLRQSLRREPTGETNPQLAGIAGQLGSLLSAHNGIGWVGTSHTSDWVVCLAKGPGQEAFEGLLGHAEVFPRLVDFAGVNHRNPTAAADRS